MCGRATTTLKLSVSAPLKGRQNTDTHIFFTFFLVTVFQLLTIVESYRPVQHMPESIETVLNVVGDQFYCESILSNQITCDTSCGMRAPAITQVRMISHVQIAEEWG